MKPVNQLLKPFSQFLLIALVGLFFIFSCQRNVDQVAASNEFNAAAAKEWYYGVFKKSAEWVSSSEHGKKLPDWKHDIYRKIGRMEIVEFPFVMGKKEILIPSTENLSVSDKERIVHASLAKIVFIRKEKITKVREVDYIPSKDYLQSHSFDISSVSLLSANNDFTGQIVIRNWKGNVVSIKALRDGKIFRSLKLRSKVGTDNGIPNSNTRTASFCDGTNDVWECVVREICDVTTWSDGMETWDNCRTEMTDECWPVYCEPDDDPDPCEGFSSEECACQMYGIGCGGGDDDQPDYTCANGQKNNFEQTAANSDIASENISSSSTVLDYDTRSITKTWKCLNGFGNWDLVSDEAGVLKYVSVLGSYRWEWVSLNHSTIRKEGNTLPGVSVSFTSGTGEPHVYSLYASMKLTFGVTYSFICDCPWLPLDWIITPIDKSYVATSPFWSAQP